MKKYMTIIIIIVGVLLILSGAGIALLSNNDNSNKNTKEEKNNSEVDPNYYKKNDDGSFTNTSSKLSEEHVFESLSIQNFKINVESKSSDLAEFSFTIKNNGSDVINFNNAFIIFIYSDGNKMRSEVSTLKTISPGDSIDVKGLSGIRSVSAIDYEFDYD